MTPAEKTMINPVNEAIDRLLHDAENARSGATFAASVGHGGASAGLYDKSARLYSQARDLYLANPGSHWPECEWPAPSFQIAEGPHD